MATFLTWRAPVWPLHLTNLTIPQIRTEREQRVPCCDGRAEASPAALSPDDVCSRRLGATAGEPGR